jgi:hypothetical protein
LINNPVIALGTRTAVHALLVLASLICTACQTTGDASVEGEPVAIEEAPALLAASATQEAPTAPIEKHGKEGEVPLVVAESEPPAMPPATELEEVVVEARARDRHEVIFDLVAEAKSMLRDVELEYVFTGKGRKETLRGRPVVFALWSEAKQEWTIAHIEIPRPPVKSRVPND